MTTKYTQAPKCSNYTLLPNLKVKGEKHSTLEKALNSDQSFGDFKSGKTSQVMVAHTFNLSRGR